MSDKASTEEKAATAGDDDTSSKNTESQNAPSAGGREQTGYEKLASTGGSGGAPAHGAQGYENLADHK